MGNGNFKIVFQTRAGQFSPKRSVTLLDPLFYGLGYPILVLPLIQC